MAKLLLIVMLVGAFANYAAPSDPPLLIDAR